MKPNPIPTVVLAGALALTALPAQDQPAADSILEPAPRPGWEEILAGGDFWLNLRLRYEYADEEGRDASNALTARTRIGYATSSAIPLGAVLELEDVRALDSDAYNQAGTNNQPGKTVIADVETTELNQGYLSLVHWDWSWRVGRQRIVLDDHRFIGNVGWRQNEQTFDAALVVYEPTRGADGHAARLDASDAALTLGYIDRVNRVFGREHSQGRWDSESYLLNFRHPIPGGGVAAAYGYLVRLDDAPALSSDTLGFYARPEATVNGRPLRFHVELARQLDNSASPAGADFSLAYFRAQVQTNVENFTLTGGYERLGGNGRFAVQTPLATLHAFNGWTDQFLVTPAQGLEEFYGHVGAKLPAALTARAGFHYFTSDRGSTTYGEEANLLVSRPFGKHVSALAKAALFDGKDGRPDVAKFWLQTELTF